MPPLSSPESLTSRSQSTQSMDQDTISTGNTPAPDRTNLDSVRNSPLTDLRPTSLATMGNENDKGIVVEPPSKDVADSTAMIVEEALPEEEADVVMPSQKRKRSSLYGVDESNGYSKTRGTPNGEPRAKRTKATQKVRGVGIGVWRDSAPPNDADKHAIYGFIDVHDRLRTRIYPLNRRGEELISNIPTGAGGCWVTFPRIIFDKHLKALNQAEVKEYVKIRTSVKPEATIEEREEADSKAAIKAMSIVAAQEAANPPKPTTARRSMGRQSTGSKQSTPRQSLNPTGFQAVNAAQIQTPKASPFAENKPNGIVIGYWADSGEPIEADKHAVYGVLGGSDSFRIKVQRLTRDGRFVDGNFPIGAGALWLHYDKVVLEPHLKSMSRNIVKEYVRIRQRDIESKESEKDRKSNELKAAREAKAIIAAAEAGNVGVTPSKVSVEPEIRHSARAEHRQALRQQAEAEAAAERVKKERSEVREKKEAKSRRASQVTEAAVLPAAQVELKNNLKKLNKVWVAQQAATMSPAPPATVPDTKTPAEEVKYHNGIKYERKQNGPFQGKLVSSAQILAIDGEDYVEYRVLTKPSFF